MNLQRLTQQQTTATVPDDAEVWDLASDEAGQAIETLASETARTVLAELYDQPQTASELANATDNSLQNINYHLKNLRQAGLIEVADSRYSRKGTEMKIYAPTTNAVLLLSRQTMADRIKDVLARFVTGIGAVALGALVFRSLVVDGVIDVPGVTVGPPGTEDTDDAADTMTDDAAPAQVEDVDDDVTDDAPDEPDEIAVPDAEFFETINPLEHLPWLLDPGVVFFLGGVFVLVVLIGVHEFRRR